jgi:hypothetical protein
MFGEYRLPHIKTPHLLISAQYDSYQLGQDGVSIKTVDPFCTKFGDKMHSVFNDLIKKDGDGTNYYYSQPCYNHAISDSAKYYESKTSGFFGKTLDDAVNTFLSEDAKQRDMTDYCGRGFELCTIGGSYCPKMRRALEKYE